MIDHKYVNMSSLYMYLDNHLIVLVIKTTIQTIYHIRRTIYTQLEAILSYIKLYANQKQMKSKILFNINITNSYFPAHFH